MKVAVDFLAPHNLALTRHLAGEIRGDTPSPAAALPWCAPDSVVHTEKEEKLQSEAILVHAARHLARAVGFPPSS